jgi:hypothetical protein
MMAALCSTPLQEKLFGKDKHAALNCNNSSSRNASFWELYYGYAVQERRLNYIPENILPSPKFPPERRLLHL